MVNSANFIVLIARKVFIFLFLIIVILLFLYILGNRQEFLDSTQIFILKLTLYASSLSFITGIILLASYILVSIKIKSINVSKVIFISLATIFCLGILLTVKFISVWFVLS